MATTKQPADPIRQIKRGDPIEAAFLNRLGRAAREVERRSREVMDRQGQYADRPKSDSGGGGAGVERFTPTTITEQLNTITLDGVTVIAKPLHLRGAAGTRVVNGETQFIQPGYTSTHPVEQVLEVVAADVGEAQTGVTGVSLLDMNIAARAWLTQ